MAHVHPTINAVVADTTGGRHHLRIEQSWDPTHPLVKAHPEWFAEDPPGVILHRAPGTPAPSGPSRKIGRAKKA